MAGRKKAQRRRAQEVELADQDEADAQLRGQQRVLEYDTKEFTIEVLLTKFGPDKTGDEDPDHEGEGEGEDLNDEGEGEDLDDEGEGDIVIPKYQRDFAWDPRRQSRFIESVLLGLPIPFLFFGDLPDGRLEVVDGSQRLRTCRAFVNNKLELLDLERLDLLDGYTFSDLPKPQQRKFLNRTIRAVVLTDNATEADRRDLFDRINTGSLTARPAEVRRGSTPGPVTDLIEELAAIKLFKDLCPVSAASARMRTRDELVTRFFAFSDNFQDEMPGYRDRVREYLDEWLKNANKRAEKKPAVVRELRKRFTTTMQFVDEYFPHGFSKTPKSKFTPMVRFDAIAVGTAEALRIQAGLAPRIPPAKWLNTDTFFDLTTSNAANVRSSILDRISYVRDQLLGR